MKIPRFLFYTFLIKFFRKTVTFLDELRANLTS